MVASEVLSQRDQLQRFYGDDDLFNVQGRTPFLADYSSDFFLAADDDSGVFWLDHDTGVERVSANMTDFLRTILRNYTSGAYTTDSEGFLDSDYEAENKIGLSLNPGCDFWTNA